MSFQFKGLPWQNSELSEMLVEFFYEFASENARNAVIELQRPTSSRGFASCFPRLRLRVFHTAVRYGKRHVKLIETSAEERVIAITNSQIRSDIKMPVENAFFHRSELHQKLLSEY